MRHSTRFGRVTMAAICGAGMLAPQGCARCLSMYIIPLMQRLLLSRTGECQRQGRGLRLQQQACPLCASGRNALDRARFGLLEFVCMGDVTVLCSALHPSQVRLLVGSRVWPCGQNQGSWCALGVFSCQGYVKFFDHTGLLAFQRHRLHRHPGRPFREDYLRCF